MATTKNGIYYPDDYSSVADVPGDMKKMVESIDTNKVQKIPGKELSANDFTNKYKKKLDSLENYDDTEVKQNMLDIEEELEKTKKEFNDYAIHGQASGEFMHLTDSAKSSCKIDIKGNVKQDGEPTLDTPAKIQTVKDSVKVTSTNKNLFNKENIEYYNNNSSAFESATNDVPTRLRTNSFELKPNDYILSGIPDNIQLIAVRAYNNKKEYIEGGAVRDNNKFTLKDNVEYVHFLFSKIDGSNINTDEISNADLMLEVGSDVTPYIEHKSQSVTVSIQQEMLTNDYLDKTNKKEVHFWDKLKVKDKISRIIKRQAENRTSFNYTVENVKPNTWTVIKNNAICNRFVQVSPYVVEKSNCFSVWNGDNVITITIDNSYLKDVSSDEKILESWNELLNKWESEGEPLELFYERQDSKEIDLTQEQIEALEKLDEMQTYKNITNITTDSIAILDVDYKKDLETWQKQQDDRITALEELLNTTQTSAMLIENLENDLLKEVE